MRKFAALRVASLALVAATLLIACAHEKEKVREREFQTSGSREADQRAEQRIIKDKQMRGGKEAPDKKTLYERLGGGDGVQTLVGDWIDRALADPRVNWRRRDVKYGRVFNIRKRSVEWNAGAENIAQLKAHVSQFIALATGGPSEYQGQNMGEVHRGMRITNAEFDAAIGDMKATLDAKKVPVTEQKELLAILESTRPQVVEVR